jgi:hypothetical protein
MTGRLGLVNKPTGWNWRGRARRGGAPHCACFGASARAS